MKKGTFLHAFIESLVYIFVVIVMVVFLSFKVRDEALLSIVSYAILIPIFALKNIKYLKKCIKNFKFSKDTIINIILYSALFIVLANFLSQTLEFITHTSPTNNDVVELQLKSTPIVILRTAFLGPIIEEFMFRVPYEGLTKHRKIIYIVYSIIFALAHVYVVDSFINYVYFFPYLLLALGIGYSFYKTDNILLSIIIHIINNLLEIMLLFI